MSGGSYDYIYSKLLETCKGEMFDAEMDEMVVDFAKVLHDLEWWMSSDSSEEDYRQTVKKFKEKWFDGKFKDNKLYKRGYYDAVNNYFMFTRELLKKAGNKNGHLGTRTHRA